MIIHSGLTDLRLTNPVVTMGVFDGIHRGHRSLIDYVVRRAGEMKGESVIITFDPPPRLVLENNKEGLSFLLSPDEKTDILRKLNVDHLVIIEFTLAFSRTRACDFVGDVLVKKIGTRHLIVGYDHHFGYRGEGNYRTIQQCAVSMGFDVEQFREVQAEEGAISSSLIRGSLLRGKIEDATRWLGYHYSLRGTVVEGRKLGRELGFPTANIKPAYDFKLIPGDGVYAVEVLTGDIRRPGMLSIGTNPTINNSGDKRSIEVNIFNLDNDLYGSTIEVIFRYRLRDEIKFSSIRQLASQMELDKAMTLKLLS